MHLELLYTPGCRNVPPTEALIGEVLAELGISAALERHDVTRTPHPAFAGSPTLLVDGRDVDPGHAPLDHPACRLYPGGGPPPRWRVEAALLRALQPKHLLFLCVANSARSQLAEHIARALAPHGVTIASAGSAPTHPRAEALEVLAERGIDASEARSTSVTDVDLARVDAVITLCEQEVCPVLPIGVPQLHWALPDPVSGGLPAFRQTADVLHERLSALFG